MLVLTRRVGETILINGNIRVTILGMAGGQVRIGTSAPAEVGIHREEVVKAGRAPKPRDRPSEGSNFAPVASEAG